LTTASSGSKILSISCDGTFAVHKWASRKVQDPSAKGVASLPFAFDIDPVLGTTFSSFLFLFLLLDYYGSSLLSFFFSSFQGTPDALSKRHLPLPFDENVLPSQSIFAVTSDAKFLFSSGHWFDPLFPPFCLAILFSKLAALTDGLQGLNFQGHLGGFKQGDSNKIP